MFGDKKVVFVMLLDKRNYSFTGLTRRIMDHHNRVLDIAKSQPVLVGRVTQELTGWKGPHMYALTRDPGWTRHRVGILRDLEDARLLAGDVLHVAGGVSLYRQMEGYVDEYMLWTVHSREGDEQCTEMQPAKWNPTNYKCENNWSFAHLKRSMKRLR